MRECERSIAVARMINRRVPEAKRQKPGPSVGPCFPVWGSSDTKSPESCLEANRVASCILATEPERQL